jgi:hypothetical protein
MSRRVITLLVKVLSLLVRFLLWVLRRWRPGR